MYIYTTKIGTFVCLPYISETVADIIMKLAHRPRIASTTNKLISKQILLSILSILLKTIQRISAGPKRRSSPPFVYGDSADFIPSLSPSPGFGQNSVAIDCALRLPSLDDRDRSPVFGENHSANQNLAPTTAGD